LTNPAGSLLSGEDAGAVTATALAFLFALLLVWRRPMRATLHLRPSRSPHRQSRRVRPTCRRRRDGEKLLRPWPQSNEEPPRPAAQLRSRAPPRPPIPWPASAPMRCQEPAPRRRLPKAPNPASGKSHRRDDNDAQPAPAATAAPVAPVVRAPPANPNAMPPPAPLSAVTPALAASRGRRGVER
jgi:hypothetical protein